MHRNIFLLVMNFYLIGVFCGCSSKLDYIRYKGIIYETPELALSAQKEEIDQVLNSITKESPIGGSAIIFIPSNADHMRNTLIWYGVRANESEKERLYKFLCSSTYNSWMCRASAISRRGIFEKVVLSHDATSQDAHSQYDYIIILVSYGDRQQWFMRTKESLKAVPIIEVADNTLPPIIQINLWLKNVEDTVKKLQERK